MPGKTNHKLKKSYTLSFEIVAFLEVMRKKRRVASASAVLEEILQAVKREQERASVDRAVASYYSSLEADEVAELAQWGDFAVSQRQSDEGV